MTDLTRERVEKWLAAVPDCVASRSISITDPSLVVDLDVNALARSWLKKDAELTNLRRDVEGVKDELSHSEKYRGQYRLRAERAEAALAEARREISEVARVCGEALGTDPELRTAGGGASALATYVVQLRDDVERDPLKRRKVYGKEIAAALAEAQERAIAKLEAALAERTRERDEALALVLKLQRHMDHGAMP